MRTPCILILHDLVPKGKSDAISHLADVDKVTGHDDGHFYSRHFCHHSHLGTFLRPFLTLLASDPRLMASHWSILGSMDF